MIKIAIKDGENFYCVNQEGLGSLNKLSHKKTP
jgi:hypothetical protein